MNSGDAGRTEYIQSNSSLTPACRKAGLAGILTSRRFCRDRQGKKETEKTVISRSAVGTSFAEDDEFRNTIAGTVS